MHFCELTLLAFEGSVTSFHRNVLLETCMCVLLHLHHTSVLPLASFVADCSQSEVSSASFSAVLSLVSL